jgi:hypothetical protein
LCNFFCGGLANILQVSFDTCDYLVESYFNRDPIPTEDYQVSMEEWEEGRCEDFLDTARTPTLGRILWVPKGIPNVRSWGKYCLYRRKAAAKTAVEPEVEPVVESVVESVVEDLEK